MEKSPRYFIQIPVPTAKRKDINSTDKLVFGEIHTILNANKYFFMSSKKLGNKIGVNPRTVIRSVEKLNHLNYIDVEFDKHDPENHKRYICHDRISGTAQSVSTGTAQSVSTGHVQNVTAEDKKRRLHRKLVKNIPQTRFEKDFKRIDKFVQHKWIISIPNNKRMLIDHLINKYGADSVIDAMAISYNNGIGINGMPNYTRAILISNKNRPKRQPRQRNNYGHAPIKEHVPDWAKDGYKPKLHRTSPKLQAKIRKQLSDLGYGKNDKHGKH